MAYRGYRLHPLSGPKWVKKTIWWNGELRQNFNRAARTFLEDYYLGQYYAATGSVVLSGSAVIPQGLGFSYNPSGSVVAFSGASSIWFTTLSPSTYTMANKWDAMKSNRSIALNAEATLKVAQDIALNIDDFNQKYLIGDTSVNYNAGVDQLIWYYYKEKNYENGTYYTAPSATSYPLWTTGWLTIDNNAQSPSGDGLNGLFPPDQNGAASQIMNTNSMYLLYNGEITSTTGGLVGACASSVLAIGDSATNPAQITSAYIYLFPQDAINAAISYLYGGVNLTKTGRGLMGRRTQNITISTAFSTPNYAYVIGNAGGNKENPTFYSNAADPNGYEANVKSNFLNGISSLLTSGDSNSLYQIHLRNLRDQLRIINNSQNPLFVSAGMTTDVTDTASSVDTLLQTLGGNTGNKNDVVAQATLWGFYNYFVSASGNEAQFDSYLYNLKSLINGTISSIFSNRANVIDDHTSNTFLGTITSKLRKWRYFWINERLGKPTGSYNTYYAISNAITSSTSQVTNAEAPLKTLFGNTRSAHLQYIPTPNSLACYTYPLIDATTGAIVRRRGGFAFDGQQHATAYRIYKTPVPPYSSANLSADTTWDDVATYYTTQTSINSSTGFVNNIFIDSGDSIAGQKFLYRVKVVDWTYTISGDTCMSLFSHLYNASVAQNYAGSADSTIHFGFSHPFKVGNYVLLQNTISSNGFYKVIGSGDTSIKVTPNHSSTNGTVYLCSNCLFT